MEISGVAEAVLYVDDLQAATRFYQDILQLPLTLNFDDSSFLQTGRDSTVILFDRDKLRKRASPIPAHGADGAGHLALAVPAGSLGAWRERLQGQGVAIEHEQTWPQGTRSLYFRDPAGNSVELIESNHYPQIWERLDQRVE